jgi:hypothetical protein
VLGARVFIPTPRTRYFTCGTPRWNSDPLLRCEEIEIDGRTTPVISGWMLKQAGRSGAIEVDAGAVRRPVEAEVEALPRYKKRNVVEPGVGVGEADVTRRRDDEQACPALVTLNEAE